MLHDSPEVRKALYVATVIASLAFTAAVTAGYDLPRWLLAASYFVTAAQAAIARTNVDDV